MTLHLRELLGELWGIALVRRLVWTPVVVLVSLAILVQLYGWYRYVTLLVAAGPLAFAFMPLPNRL